MCNFDFENEFLHVAIYHAIPCILSIIEYLSYEVIKNIFRSFKF